MPGICPRCGLPLEICVCETLQKEGLKRIKIYSEKRKFNRIVTIVEGLDGEELEKTAKELKKLLATGGTYKNGVIELQGDHKDAVKKALLKIGYSEESIESI
ncbi:MAG: stress response translation initiation inhibitor YciH [Candidatus Micrarchaeaceae archaeon]